MADIRRYKVGPAQVRMLRAWRDYVADKGYQPSVRDMAAALGLSSLNAVIYVRNKLIRRGLLEHSGMELRARSVLITPAGHELLRERAGDRAPLFSPGEGGGCAGIDPAFRLETCDPIQPIER